MKRKCLIKLTDFERSPKLAEIRAVYKNRCKSSERTTINEPVDIAKYLRLVWNQDTLDLAEDFVVICLNVAHRVNGWVKIASGGINSTTVDARLVFAIALQTASTAIILAHNHPSGNLVPSFEDKELTTRIQSAGKLLGIRVLDHVILTRESYFSFTESGLLTP